jgi:uroporphyrinogen-III synthase
MTILKKLCAVILMCCMSHAFAATQDSINRMTEDFMDSLAQRVTLTEAQKESLQPVLFNNLNAREDVIASYLGQKGMSVKMKIRDQLQPINLNMQSEAQSILTPEQFDAFKLVQETKQAEVKERINRDF